ncbi:hypothetical protein GF342_02355 [Candidatus Woesearchaeota archaeon]|nr:hypothetical protein [Candidatus Woesearchaeota archaeon]
MAKEVKTVDTSIGKEVMPQKRFKPLKIAIIFVIILLVAGGGAGLYVWQSNKFSSSFDTVSVQVESCLATALQASLLDIGIRGGKAEFASNALDLGTYKANPLYLNGRSLVPTPAEVNAELGKSIESMMSECIKQAPEGVTITPDPFDVQVTTAGDKTKATLLSPIAVKSSFFGKELKNLAAQLTFNPGSVLVPIDGIVSHVASSGGIVDVEALKRPGFEVSYEVKLDQNKIVFLVQDLSQSITGKRYAWVFFAEGGLPNN